MAPTVNGNAGGSRAHLSKGTVFVNLQSGLGDQATLADVDIMEPSLLTSFSRVLS